VPLSATANFTSYSADRFGVEEQVQLARLAQTLQARGVAVVLSNHDTEFTRRAYGQASELVFFPVQRYISCDGANRNKAAELLAIFRP
jgi:DNA adenine methylase